MTTIHWQYAWRRADSLMLEVQSHCDLNGFVGDPEWIIVSAEDCESAVALAQSVSERVSSGQLRTLQHLTLPLDAMQGVDWEVVGPKLKSLALSSPCSGEAYQLYKSGQLPMIPESCLQALEALDISCPLNQWKNFDIARLSKLKWIGLLLDDLDKSGASMKLIGASASISAIDVFSPKGDAFLDLIPLHVDSLAIHMWARNNVDTRSFLRFRALRSLVLRGGSSMLDMEPLAQSNTLEELEVTSYNGLLNISSLRLSKRLRRLDVSGISKLTESDKIQLESLRGYMEVFIDT